MFYHIEIQTIKNKTTQGIFPHATLEEAVAAFHYALYYQANNADCASCLAMVIDNTGAVYKSEKYVKPAETEE